MLLRLLTTGVCLVCVVMVAAALPLRVEVVRPVPAPMSASALRAPRDAAPALSVVDVAAGVSPSALVSLLGLASNEWISAINDAPIYSDLEAGARVVAMAPRPGQFVDLTVSSRRTERRVLVLMH
ncbi:MAG TPA: hypothetical protein VFK02_25155 [Kofleriaceae bacterium]|nr:hypothetical protein [Kofleriaceae bacterium]